MPEAPVLRDVYETVRPIELAWIPMSDGRRLAARLWLPKDAEQKPVPAILEYIPYRRRDGTRMGDEPTHAWFAAQGYASARVDIAGSGDSDGLLRDEYLKQEQDDAVEIIAWLARQPWCSGAVGMIGISWGGFNGLQVAARRPPELKAVITLCSTVDRYADDVHFMGGCLLNDNLDWGGCFFSVAGVPPDPAMVGPDWRARWLERLEVLQPFPALWLQHQRRDAFWRHGSVCEDYGALQCPVLAVGGWADGYTAAIFRLVENMQAPCKGIVGPWGHLYPHHGLPEPAIGFLQECKRWWDRWLKGEANGVEEDPALRLWQQDPVPPRSHYNVRPGRWIALEGWPAAAVERQRWALNPDGLATTAGARETLTIRSPQTTGMAGGEWCPYGLGKVAPEMPLDQRIDDAGSLVFDSSPLDAPLNLVGDPVALLEIAADQPQALVAVRLSDVAPNGEVTRVTYGLLNLSHRDGHAEPTALESGRRYRVRVRLNEAAHRFAIGHRLRVAISSSYWPMVWPAPVAATLSLTTGESLIELPILPEAAVRAAAPFEPVEYATPLRVTELRAGGDSRLITQDVATGRTTLRIMRDDGCHRIDDIGTEVAYTKLKEMSISEGDPLSMRQEVAVSHQFRRDDWDARLETRIVMTCDIRYFILQSDVDAYADGARLFSRSFHHRIPRDHL
ncbi:MAG TPA: CocE/NonD family hydrolase [Dongiaceae bacterium]|nr:CocE/NonD family hydrolase [Dongiaceae bacterium]